MYPLPEARDAFTQVFQSFRGSNTPVARKLAMSQVHYRSLATGRQDIRFHEAKDYWGEGCCVFSRSVVSDSATPCTVGRQVPLSMEFLQARILEWVAMLSLQGIFPIQGLNPGVWHCRRILYHLSHQGSPRILEWVPYPFSRASFWPGIELVSPALQAGSLSAELSGKLFWSPKI